MKNILVTGGCGFIGSHLVDRLAADGFSVHVIDNLSTGSKKYSNAKARYHFEDLRTFVKEEDRLREIISKNRIETLFHLAALASVRESTANPITTYDVNLLSSIALVNIALRHGVKKFIFASTSAVYGEATSFPIDEKHVTKPLSPYGLSKLAFEQYLETRKNISVTTLRLPNVYGPRQRPDLEAGVVAIFHHQVQTHQPTTIFGDGLQTRDWVHVDDIVRAFQQSMQNTSPLEIANLGSGRETRLIDLFHLLSKITGYTKAPLYAPAKEGDVKRMVLSGERALKVLGWRAEISLEEGLRRVGEKGA